MSIGVHASCAVDESWSATPGGASLAAAVADLRVASTRESVRFFAEGV
jgi:hypothetical protein